MECFLSASPMGAPVYGKLGFEEIAGGRVEVALEGFGGRVGEVHVHGEFGFCFERKRKC